MSKAKKESFFWTSYADLMTSLFFVMLVLFVLAIVLLHNKIRATEAELKKIKEIEESVQNIDPQYFQYDADFKRHTLKDITVSFKTGSSNINDIPEDDLGRLYQVGEAIKSFVDNAVAKNADIKYLLIIEGQSSKDNYNRNYELSYERALALLKYWKAKGIFFDIQHLETIISGSGQESPFRVHGNEKLNQRFVIHIIPKMGEIGG